MSAVNVIIHHFLVHFEVFYYEISAKDQLVIGFNK